MSDQNHNGEVNEYLNGHSIEIHNETNEVGGSHSTISEESAAPTLQKNESGNYDEEARDNHSKHDPKSLSRNSSNESNGKVGQFLCLRCCYCLNNIE